MDILKALSGSDSDRQPGYVAPWVRRDPRRRGRTWKITKVLFLRHRRKTNRATTNAAPDDANQEPAVEAVVEREPVPRIHLQIEFHFFILNS
jgi:hypothetical protein